MFFGKGDLKTYCKFTGKHPCRIAISVKLQSNFRWKNLDVTRLEKKVKNKIFHHVYIKTQSNKSRDIVQNESFSR